MDSSFDKAPTRRLEGGDTPIEVGPRRSTPEDHGNVSIRRGARDSRARNERRKTSFDEFERAHQHIRSTFSRLNGIWDSVDLDEDSRLARQETFFGLIYQYIDDIVSSEEEMAENVKEGIVLMRKQIEFMEDHLQLKGNFARTSGHLRDPSIALTRLAEKEVKRLVELYSTRRDEQRDMLEELATMAVRIGKNAVELLPQPEKVPASIDPEHQLVEVLFSPAEQKKLQKMGNELEKELNERLERANAKQKDLREYTPRIVHLLGESVDADLQMYIDSDYNSVEFHVTDEVLRQIDEYHAHICDIYGGWLENWIFKWEEEHGKLEELWNKCHVSHAERAFPAAFNPALHGDRDFEDMQAATERLQGLQEQRQPIYDLVDLWKAAWQQKLDLEEKKRDPNYYQSRERGHNVSKDVKVMERLNKELPEKANRLLSAYADYRKAHPDDVIRIDGLTPPEFLKWVEDEHKLGLAVKLPAASTGFVTPRGKKTPLRMAARANTDEPSRKKPLLDFNISMIGPAHPVETGPKASTPKQSLMPSGPSTGYLSPAKRVRATSQKPPFINMPSPSPSSPRRTPGRTPRRH